MGLKIQLDGQWKSMQYNSETGNDAQHRDVHGEGAIELVVA